MNGYLIPARKHRIETMVVNSRFIATVDFAPTAADARAFIHAIRNEMPDASHHVYAFRAGYGNSVTEGLSDDGEPSGTSGPPVMAVLRGQDIGDVVIVVTRYFGGTKLGTGGLVRAYSDAAREALLSLPLTRKIARTLVGFDLPYPLYEQVKRLISAYEGEITEETFAADVTLLAVFPDDQVPAFDHALSELTAGRIKSISLGSV
ncbi:MAG: YigZ family protein [Anaerolinea sp.]|nr:YigZ family protein [Anaerolinea sp.]